MYIRSLRRNRVLRIDCEFLNYDFVIAKGKDRGEKGSVPEVIQAIRGTTSGFDKTNRNTFFNHLSSAPSPFTVLLFTKAANFTSKTNAVLPHFSKADSNDEERVVIVGQKSALHKK